MNTIIEQIATTTRTRATKTEPGDMIHVGDHILLLTGSIRHQASGIRCINGDKAQVATKKVSTESAAIHFTVEQHSRNVQKIA